MRVKTDDWFPIEKSRPVAIIAANVMNRNCSLVFNLHFYIAWFLLFNCPLHRIICHLPLILAGINVNHFNHYRRYISSLHSADESQEGRNNCPLTVAILLYRFLSCWCLETSFTWHQPCSLLFVFYNHSHLDTRQTWLEWPHQKIKKQRSIWHWGHKKKEHLVLQ